MEALGKLRAPDVASVMRVYRDLLRSHQESLNRLNVYPVPDGDTGTNMALTVESVVTELDEAAADGSEPSLEQVCTAMARGSLMGARGNSGVILSQLLRGIAGVLGTEGAGDGAHLVDALVAASDLASKAVLRPVEGTILTVARKAAEAAACCLDTGSPTLVAVAEQAREQAAVALAKTPDQLPALARAGVVDAGGAGYLLLLDALLHVIDARALPELVDPSAGQGMVALPGQVSLSGTSGAPGADAPANVSEADVALGEHGLRYEVMYLLEASDDTIPPFKEVWAGLGDSIVIVGGGGLWNCHIHTDDIGGALEAGVDAGRPRNIRVTDLLEQVEEERWVREGSGGAPSEDPGPPPRTAVVAVATGEGIARIFWSLGAHHIVSGGQSMNPSTSQILEVVDSVPSPEVVLLPNNENIHAVANQVVHLANKPVRVVPTSGIVDGFAALLEYDPESGSQQNAANMAESARRVVSGEITRAVRDSASEVGPIEPGDWLGLSRQAIEVVGKEMVEVCCSLLDKLLTERHELVTLIEGDAARHQDTRRISDWLEELHPDVAVEVHHGGQPLYPYLISIE